MKEYKERDRGTGVEVDVFKDEELPYLSASEKKFCRLFIEYGEKSPAKAAKEIYSNQKNPTGYGGNLLRKPKIEQYLKFLREDICEIKDADGNAKYSIQARIKELERLTEGAQGCNNFQAAANFQTLKENLIGTRRVHSLNLAEYDNDEQRRQALFDAVATGEIDREDFKTFIKALQDRQDMQVSVNRFRAEIPDNGMIDE